MIDVLRKVLRGFKMDRSSCKYEVVSSWARSQRRLFDSQKISFDQHIPDLVMAWGYLHGRPSIFVLLTLAFQATHALSTGDIVALSKRQGCSGLEAQCESSAADCVDYICNSCRDLSSVISQCCAGTDDTAIMACLQTGLEGGLGSGSAATSEAVTSALVTSALPTSIVNDPNYIACTSWQGIFENCESQTPGFSNEPFTSKALCLCYSSETYVGSVYDGYYSSCLAYFSTGDPSGYSQIQASAGGPITSRPCSANAGALTASAGPTTAASNSITTLAPTTGNGGFLTHAPSPSSIPSPATAKITSSTVNNGGVTTTSTSSGQGKIQVRRKILTSQTLFTD